MTFLGAKFWNLNTLQARQIPEPRGHEYHLEREVPGSNPARLNVGKLAAILLPPQSSYMPCLYRYIYSQLT